MRADGEQQQVDGQAEMPGLAGPVPPQRGGQSGMIPDRSVSRLARARGWPWGISGA
jgi:hypothetical protein